MRFLEPDRETLDFMLASSRCPLRWSLSSQSRSVVVPAMLVRLDHFMIQSIQSRSGRLVSGLTVAPEKTDSEFIAAR
jgi:hypothetical protein